MTDNLIPHYAVDLAEARIVRENFRRRNNQKTTSNTIPVPPVFLNALSPQDTTLKQLSLGLGSAPLANLSERLNYRANEIMLPSEELIDSMVTESGLFRTVTNTFQEGVFYDTIILRNRSNENSRVVMTLIDSNQSQLGFCDLSVNGKWIEIDKPFEGGYGLESNPRTLEVSPNGIPYPEIRFENMDYGIKVQEHGKGYGSNLFCLALELAVRLNGRRMELLFSNDGTNLNGKSWYERFSPTIDEDRFIFDLS